MHKSMLCVYWALKHYAFIRVLFQSLFEALENKCMHFNCAIQSPGHNHSWYTTSWSHLCLSFAPPSPHVGCMSCFSPWICAARVPAGLVSFANSALYLRLKEINTGSASQNHSNTSAALANKTTGKRAALPVCAQQQACHAVWSSGKP